MVHEVCSRCSASNIDYAPDGNLTCFECGCIIEEDDKLTSEVTLVTSGDVTRASGSLVPVNASGATFSSSFPRGGNKAKRPPSFYGAAAPSNAKKTISRICSVMSLGQTLADQMLHTYDQITTKNIKYCRSPELLGASVVYIVLRQNNKPFTLLDLADKTPCNVFALGKVFARVLQNNQQIFLSEVDPALFVEKAISQIGIAEAQRMAIKLQAVRIINAVKSEWIMTGRRHAAITAAALAMAMEALNFPLDFRNMCTTLKVAEGTVKSRMREMKAALLTQAQAVIPWVADLNVKNVHKQLKKMLDQLETIARVFDKDKGISMIDDTGSDPETDPSSPLSSPPTPSSPPAVNFPLSSSSRPTTPSSPHCTVHPVNIVNRPSTPTSAPPTPSLPTPSPPTSSPPTPTTQDQNKNGNTSITSNTSNNNNNVIIKLESPTKHRQNFPPSYRLNMEAREWRAKKLDQAKQRIKGIVQKFPSMLQMLSPQLKIALLSNAPALPATPSIPLHNNRKHPRRPSKRNGRFVKELGKEDVASVLLALESGDVDLDQEDLTIERLLLNGTSDEVILNGYYDAETGAPSIQPHPNLHSEKVGEEDIPDSEMDKFIRSPDEVQMFAQLFAEKGMDIGGDEEEEKKEKGKDKGKKRERRKGKEAEKQKEEEKKEEEKKEEEEDKVEEKEIEGDDGALDDDYYQDEEEEEEEKLQRNRKMPRYYS